MKNNGYTSLDEEIYMICFSQPRYPGEIKELLATIGRTTQQSQLLLNNPKSRITKLIKKGWLEELTKEEKQKIIGKINDKRAKRRRYVQSTLKPLIEYFKEQIKLAKNEERQLKHIIEKRSFRPMLAWELGFRSFYSVKEFLFLYTFWTNIAIKYTEPYRKKKKKGKISKVEEKKLFYDFTSQLLEKRNTIADRVAPELRVDWSSSDKDQFYSFIVEANDKLKPPLFDKLMKLSNNQMMFFQIALGFLACGEFINELQQKQTKK